MVVYVTDKLSKYVTNVEGLVLGASDYSAGAPTSFELLIELPSDVSVEKVQLYIEGWDTKVEVLVSSDGVNFTKIKEFYASRNPYDYSYLSYYFEVHGARYLLLTGHVGKIGYILIKDYIGMYLNATKIIRVSNVRLRTVDVPYCTYLMDITVENVTDYNIGVGHIYVSDAMFNNIDVRVSIPPHSRITVKEVPFHAKVGENNEICAIGDLNKECFNVNVPLSRVAEVSVKPYFDAGSGSIFVPYEVRNLAQSYGATVNLRITVNGKVVHTETIELSEFEGYSSGINLEPQSGGEYVIQACADFDWGVLSGTVCSEEKTVTVQLPQLEWRNFRIMVDGEVIDPATTEIPLDKTVSVYGELWNVGTIKAYVVVFMTVDGQEVRNKPVEVAPGEYVPVEWDVPISKAKPYEICLDYR